MRHDSARAHPGEAIDLAAVPDFALGPLRVQPSLRRVNAGVREALVEPRVMQALVALTEASEAVLSRDALIDRCWSGRIVGDDAINRCIAKVRRLADMSEPPAFLIDTVAKVGYRLRGSQQVAGADAGTVPPAAADAAEMFSAEAAPAAPTLLPGRSPSRPERWRRRRLLALAAGIVLVGAAGSALWGLRPAPRWTVESSRKLPKLDGETEPRISPNGSMMAYTVNPPGGHGRIYVRPLQGGEPVAVSPAIEDAGSPSWASDGVRLAYVVADPGGAPCRIVVTSLPDGGPRDVGRCRQFATTQIAWQPGTPYLFLVDQVPALEGQLTGFWGAIFRMNIETGRSEQVTTPLTSESDFGARVSPDGEWVAYIRSRGLAGQAVRLRRIASSEEREILNDPDVSSIDWTPDSQTLVASVPGQMGGALVAYPIDGSRAYKVYISASVVSGLATGPDGLLAAEVDEGRHNLARASRTPQARADIIDAAAGLTDWPVFAPDGTLAFVSNRSGEMALWTRKPGRAPGVLVKAGQKGIERPVWSPDGSRIAYVEIWKGDISIHVVTARGERVVAFAVPSVGYGEPVWTPDGEHLVMYDKRLMRAVRIDLKHPDDRQTVADKLLDGITFRNGAVYSTSGIKSGIWELSSSPAASRAATGEFILDKARLITPDYPVERRPRLAFIGDDVLMPGTRAGDTLQVLAQPLAGGPNRVAFYAPAAEAGTPFAVDPLSGDVIYVSELAVDSHIELLQIARY